MKIRRVVHLVGTPIGVGGAETVLVSLVRTSEAKGWHALVLNPFDTAGEDSDLARLLPQGAYMAESCSRWSLGRARRWCAERLIDLKPNLVHVHMAHAGLVGATLRLGAPKVLTHHHGDYFSAHRMHFRSVVDRWATRRFDHIVAVSSFVSKFLTENYGIDPKKLTVIPNGWRGEPRNRQPPEQPTVVTVGNIRPGKGHDVLVKAFALVLKAIPTAHLVVVGDGPLKPRIMEMASSLLSSSSVRFIGSVDDVWPHLAGADVFVIPSFTETAGIAAMEAMASGLPVVGSEVGGLPELVRPYETGLLVSPGDPIRLAAAIVETLSLPDRGSGWGVAGKEVSKRFTANTMADSYFKLYESLVKDDGGTFDG